MLEAGVDVAVVSKSLGHTTLATTVDVSTHWMRRMQEKSAARMDEILGAATG